MFDKTTTVLLKVEGMSCMHCQKRVGDALTAVKGVKKAEVDLEKGEAAVVYVPGKVSVDGLIQAVTDIGFSAACSQEG